MSRDNKLKIIFIAISMIIIMLLSMFGKVFATSGGITIINSNNNNVTDTGNNTPTPSNNTPTPSNNTPTTLNTNYNTSNNIPVDNTAENTNLPYAGSNSENNVILIVFMVIAGISMIYTYKKIKDYNI